MSRSNLDKPFYVDVGTSIVAVRCASNHDVVLEYDHSWRPSSIELAKTACDRMNREVEIHNSGDCAKLRETVKETQSAIARCMDILNKIPDSCGYGGLLDDVADELCELREEHVKTALAAPPRNCDVGTVTDQRKRYAKMCQYNCDRCALQDDRSLKGGCEFSWEQLPYEEGGDK